MQSLTLRQANTSSTIAPEESIQRQPRRGGRALVRPLPGVGTTLEPATYLHSAFEIPILARRAIVRVQNPIHLGDFSEPQPDLALVEQHVDYAQGHPIPEDVLLVIEVVDTSVATDQDVKIPLYARADISEAWLIDLPAHRVIVYRQPSPQGYQEAIRLGRGDSIVVASLCRYFSPGGRYSWPDVGAIAPPTAKP